ncbi:MAG: hypothetical protein WDZ46_05095 [Solirubrobacterales bacterium]
MPAYPFVRLLSEHEHLGPGPDGERVRDLSSGALHDWPRMMTRTCKTERRWLGEPDLSAWLAGNRLNLLRALPDHAAEPPVQVALERYLTNVEPAIERLEQLNGTHCR